MRLRNLTRLMLAALLGLSAQFAASRTARAQSQAESQTQGDQKTKAEPKAKERRAHKNFGSSLERLKWDDLRKAAVEAKRKKEKGGGTDEEDVVRVETSLVVCDLLVLDKQGRSVQGLTREDFDVSEDAQPQQVGVFSLGGNASMQRSIVLIIDYSGSQFPFIKTSVEAAKTLVDKLGPADRMAIVTDDVELIQDFTQDREKLKKKLESLEKKAEGNGGGIFGPPGQRFGRSAQFSALLATLKEMFDDEDLRPVIIFQTDGDELSLLRDPIVSPIIPPNLLPPEMQKEQQRVAALMQRQLRDEAREFSYMDVFNAAEKSRATIYTIVPGFRLIGLTPDEQLKQLEAYRERRLSAWYKPKEVEKQRERMEERARGMPAEVARFQAEQSLKTQLALLGVSKITGGWLDFLEDPSQASEIYSRILTSINQRYLVGYYSTNKEHDGKRRTIKVEVRGHPEYTVWGRKSYYAPAPEQ